MARKRTYVSGAGMAAMKLEAPYYNAIETTEITFENEKIIAYADSLGHIEFFDLEMNTLGFVDVPVSKDPSEKGHTAQYGDMECYVDSAKIVFRLPVYGWEDNYPHCDGEFDRWDRYVARWFSVLFDCETKEIKIADGQ